MSYCFDKQVIKQKLVDMGYSPQENGEYFRMKAIYRGGNTNSSLSVNYKTGYFYDFSACSGGTFSDLVKLTTGLSSEAEIKNFLNDLQGTLTISGEKGRIKMEKIYNADILERLFPIYNHFTEKGIEEITLKKYKCGFCSSGELNRRIVFPIFNKEGQIHGFTGRHISWNKESKFPKWKHAGKTSNWIYPVYIREKDNFPFLDAIKKKKEIILVESVGDSLALSQNGYFNNMVCFGLNISPKQLAFIAGLELDRIIIATNNDFLKKDNSGAISAMKIYLKLVSDYIDVDKLIIALPVLNDFSDMQKENSSFDDWYKKKAIGFKKQETLKYILKTLTIAKDDQQTLFTKKDISKIETIESLCQN
jgi:hypothetical protein